jgi:hypothetical protein
MTETRYTRKLSAAERLWLALDYQGMSMAYFLVVDGKGDIPVTAMSSALQKLAEIYPICRSTIRGHLKNLRWEESGVAPRYIERGKTSQPLSEWPTEEERRLYFEQMDLKHEAPVAVYSFTDGFKHRLYFKIHHCALDGVATYFLVNDIFAILRGEQPLGESEGPDTREDIYAAVLPKDYFEKRQEEFKRQRAEEKKTGASTLIYGSTMASHIINPPTTDKQVEWTKIFIPYEKLQASSVNGLLISLSMEALSRTNPKIRTRHLQAGLAVDLRFLIPGLRKAANLAGLVTVDVDKYFPLTVMERATPISADIKAHIKAGDAIRKHPTFVEWLPIWFMSMIMSIYRKFLFRRRLYSSFFPLANGGRYSLPKISTEKYTATGAWGVPMLQINTPLFTGFLTHENGIEFTLASDTDKHYFEQFVKNLKDVIDNIEK